MVFPPPVSDLTLPDLSSEKHYNVMNVMPDFLDDFIIVTTQLN